MKKNCPKLTQEKCVLVYDDDEEIRNITSIILSEEYKQVEVRSNCQNLFEDICKLNPHLILMDIRMPFIDGEYAIELLHANEKTKNIPVVVFSASFNIKKVSKRINATAMIEKPFNIDDLREIVRKHIA